MRVNGIWLRPSEAMRLGSFATKPLVGQIYEYDATGAVIGTCALGAMYFALGSSLYDIVGSPPSLHLPYRDFLQRTRTCCPVCQTGSHAMLHLIMHLNDYHRWTRLDIAEWVAQTEECGHWQAPSDEPSPSAIDAQPIGVVR